MEVPGCDDGKVLVGWASCLVLRVFLVEVLVKYL